MKKSLAFIFIFCFALVFAACGGAASSAVPSSVPAKSAVASPAASAVAQNSAAPAALSAAASTPNGKDLAKTVAALAEGAQLGGTIKISEIDLKAGGVNTDNIEAFDGAESQLSAQNGGIVIVIKAKPGTAQTIATEMAAYREYRLGNTDYAEFEDARTNTEDARISVFEDYVVYAVSATGLDGGWAALDAAILSAFTQ